MVLEFIPRKVLRIGLLASIGLNIIILCYLLARFSVARNSGLGALEDHPRISDIVVPFIPTQLPLILRRIRLWNKYPPCIPAEMAFEDQKVYAQAGRNIRLTFFSSRAENITLRDTLLQSFHELRPNVKSCFRSVDVAFADLTGREDSYERGTRTMFEMLLDNFLELDRPYYVLYMEPDVLPIRDFWLTALDASCRTVEAPFWIKGSLYRGGSTTLPRGAISSATHINGNAIYNLRDSGLRDFYYRYIEPIHRRNTRHRLAYDQDFFAFMAHPANYKVLQQVAHRFRYTAMIQNWWRWTFSMTDLVENDELVFLVHGGNPKL